MAEGSNFSMEDLATRKASVSKGRPNRILSLEELLKNRTEKWDIYSATQNLPSVLNDPNNRELDLFTKTWGEGFLPYASVPPTSLPNIELGDFLCYLRETSSVCECIKWLVGVGVNY